MNGTLVTLSALLAREGALPIARSMELFIQEADAGKSFYKGASEAVKPREIDPNLQTVIDKALGKTTAAPPVDAPAAPVAKTAAPVAKTAAPVVKTVAPAMK